MTRKFQMQAASTADDRLRTYLLDAPDWSGAGFTGPGSAVDVTLYSAPSQQLRVAATMAAAVQSPQAAMFGSIGSGSHMHASMAALVNSPFATFSATTNFALDPRIIAWHEPDSGFADLTPTNPPFGSLVQTSGSVAIGGNLDGHALYQLAKATGGYLVSTNNAEMCSGNHVFIVGRFTGSPTVNDAMFGAARGNPSVTGATGVASLKYSDSTHMLVDGGGPISFPTNPTAFRLYEAYYHGKHSRVSVNGGTYATGDISSGGYFSGIELGHWWAGNRSDCEIAFVLVYEGKAPAAFKNALYAYLAAKFPSLGLGAAPADFSTDTIAPALWNPALPWNAVIVGGQSNASNYATSASATWNAGTYLLGNDRVWKAGVNPWDSSSGQVDAISLDPVGTVGGLGGALANALHASWGIPTVLVPNALSASYIVPGAAGLATNRSWERSYPRNQHQRNSLYWSMIDRAKQVILWGGTIKAFVWYQGNSEAQATPTIYNQWPAKTQDLIDNFWADVGLPNPRLNVGDRSRTTVVVRVEKNTNNPAQYETFRTTVVPTIAQNANQIMVDPPAGPFEADLAHLINTSLDTLGGTIASAILS